MNTKNGINYFYKVKSQGQEVDRCKTHSKRRFLNKTRLINWKIYTIKVYLKVSYGKGLNVFNKLVNFSNEGVYENRADFEEALAVFTEDI
jgi:hypothetical protein